MSAVGKTGRVTVPEIRSRKNRTPVVALTAYSALTAKLIDPFVDIVLVGDSLGMVMYGFESTIPVPLEVMIWHGAAAVRGTERALVIIDMPYGSYEESPQQAFRNAARVMKETGCAGVKIEGGARMAETIRFLTERGIPVMAHIGLTPQSVHVMGGYKAQGRDPSEWPSLQADARAIDEAGAFSVVLEGVAEPLAEKLTNQLSIPTIGIGASAACDGQVLVLEDMLGLTGKTPKFVREFAQLGGEARAAVETYANAVRDRSFPASEHTYTIKAGSGEGVVAASERAKKSHPAGS